MNCPILGMKQVIPLDLISSLWMTDVFYAAGERCYVHTVVKRVEQQGKESRYFKEVKFEMWQARWSPRYPVGEMVIVQIWHELESDSADLLIQFAQHCPFATLVRILDGLTVGGLREASMQVSDDAQEVREKFNLTAGHRVFTSKPINVINLRELIKPTAPNGPGK